MALLAGPAWAVAGPVSEVGDDEIIRFFPTVAHQDGEDWVVPIHAWVYEAEDEGLFRGAAIDLLRVSLGLGEDDAAGTVFERRTRLFLVDNERGKKLVVQVGERVFPLPGKTGSEGHLISEIRISGEQAESESRDGWLHFEALLDNDDARRFPGTARLLPPTGLTVISDIDDTVKVSYVTDTEKLLHKTFLERFQAVPGMSLRFQQWTDEGAFCIFVSSSPWQLLDEIEPFLERSVFPASAYSLKTFRLKDQRFLDLFADPLASKLRRIEDLMATHPQRVVVLVGDTGERDPEVYGEIARRHPDRVRQIVLRNVTGTSRQSERMRAALVEVTPDKVSLIDPE